MAEKQGWGQSYHMCWHVSSPRSCKQLDLSDQVMESTPWKAEEQTTLEERRVRLVEDGCLWRPLFTSEVQNPPAQRSQGEDGALDVECSARVHVLKTRGSNNWIPGTLTS